MRVTSASASTSSGTACGCRLPDDGSGLPGDYATRGQGFRNMREDAERLGGRLVVETSGPEWRTAVTCELPYRHMRGES